MEKTGLIIGIVIALLAVGAIVYNNVRRGKEKRKPKTGWHWW
jgi:hypothetical protein